MILSCQNISKAFNEETILKGVSFHIEDYEKAAIVGINGAGKTTLLRIIVGELTPDEGLITLSRGKTFGYLSQNQNVNSDNTLYDEMRGAKADVIALEEKIRETELSMKQASGHKLEELMEAYSRLTHAFELAGGYAYKSEITGVLKGLGFAETDFSKQISTLSGGEKTRTALGKLLLLKPDLIILDEPTNHLDLNSIAWLETYLLNYKGAVLIVSHDRYFLDKIAGKIIEIDQTRATSYTGNYSDYAVKREQLRSAALNAYFKQQQEIRHQEAVIEKLRSFNREKSIKRAESREKLLQKMDVLEKPTEAATDIHMTLTPRVVSGNDVIHIEGLSKSFGSRQLFSDIDMDIKRGEHVAVIGDNGAGKTTILKIINGLLDADAGTITLGTNVHIGYYDQEHHVLHMDKTLFDEISDEYPYLNQTEIRNTLAAFLFTGDDVYKRIGDLSGGERGRLSLARLMLSEANFLILDEPTNHLDITSKEILEDALNSYEGTVLYVSHDRYFINRTASRILDLKEKTLTGYLGNYDYYLEKKEASSKALPSWSVSSSGKDAAPSENKLDWQAKKEQQAKARKKENDLRKCEEAISALEKRIAGVESDMLLPENATNAAKLQELAGNLEEMNGELLGLYEKWEELSV
ncbi:MAG: ABC-F family ATP-binding cassette domain-containing protein [Lachnospiraceae bacterium]|nr:ABC-F family ATP-binding cassette domain-containing protein [Lachnospiraceae bacterium]MCI9327351.1 ABC-F family ATP-binding cassette domain-containing protein [Lachnospiraceae bacterium]